jgi:hypothetical protein
LDEVADSDWCVLKECVRGCDPSITLKKIVAPQNNFSGSATALDHAIRQLLVTILLI